MTPEELAGLESKALAQFKTGKSLFGKDGAFAPLLQSFLEKALEAEMEAHLDEDERKKGNKRNGKGKKTVKSSSGELTISTPQDASQQVHEKYASTASREARTVSP